VPADTLGLGFELVPVPGLYMVEHLAAMTTVELKHADLSRDALHRQRPHRRCPGWSRNANPTGAHVGVG
jgi:hypothetical protein